MLISCIEQQGLFILTTTRIGITGIGEQKNILRFPGKSNTIVLDGFSPFSRAHVGKPSIIIGACIVGIFFDGIGPEGYLGAEDFIADLCAPNKGRQHAGISNCRREDIFFCQETIGQTRDRTENTDRGQIGFIIDHHIGQGNKHIGRHQRQIKPDNTETAYYQTFPIRKNCGADNEYMTEKSCRDLVIKLSRQGILMIDTHPSLQWNKNNFHIMEENLRFGKKMLPHVPQIEGVETCHGHFSPKKIITDKIEQRNTKKNTQ